MQLFREEWMARIRTGVAVAACSVVGGVVYWDHKKRGKKRVATIERFIKAQQDIVKIVDPVTKKQVKRLSVRTRPNHRLITTFGIDNAFTTDDTGRHGTFVNQAKGKLQGAIGIAGSTEPEMAEADWRPLITLMKATTTEVLVGLSDNESLNLAEVVQTLTLKVSLKYLFDLQDEDLKDTKTLGSIARRINELWLASKNAEAEGGFPKWENQTELHTQLRTITQLDPMNHKENPLNFILPAYETMWRAVFRGVLEVHFRAAPDAAKWKEAALLLLLVTSSLRVTPSMQ